MITATMSAVLVLASSVGVIHCRHERRVDGDGPVVCEAEDAAVLDLITRLQTCPQWRARERAARALKKYDWHCHPEAAEALAGALLHDCEREVREEAARSLAKMKPCLPVVHEAVARAAKDDSHWLTRLLARKALKGIGKTCVETCSLCGPEAAEPSPITFPTPDGQIPEPLMMEPLEAPAIPSGVSPFSPGAGLPSPIPGASIELSPIDDPSIGLPRRPPLNPAADSAAPVLTPPRVSTRLGDELAGDRSRPRSVPPVMIDQRPNLASFLLGGDSP